MAVSPDSRIPDTHPIHFAGARFHLDPRRALWWAAEKTLVVSDLHLGKGQSLAKHGVLLPPYDAGDTLVRLLELIGQYAPGRVLCLGDSFHRKDSLALLPEAERAMLLRAVGMVPEWVWIVGNHDEGREGELPGVTLARWDCRGIRFQHEPGASESYRPLTKALAGEEAGVLGVRGGGVTAVGGDSAPAPALSPAPAPGPARAPALTPALSQRERGKRGRERGKGEASPAMPTVIGHFHPRLQFYFHKRRMYHPCFAWNERLLVLPSFGSFTGGLEVREEALLGLLGKEMRLACATGSEIFRVEKQVFK